MYRINYTGRPTLVTPDEVLFHMAADKDVAPRDILQNIIVAEERWIAQAMGDEFYYDFCNAKNVEVTSTNQASLLTDINASLTAAGKPTIVLADIPIGIYVNAIELVTNSNYVELWKWFLWKLCSECVALTTIVPTWLRQTAQGQQKNNPAVIGGNGSGSETGDRKDVQFKIDKYVQDRIDPLLERMHLWLCKRKSSYSLYTKACDCGDDGVSFKRKTDWVFMDDSTSCGCGQSTCNSCANGIITEDSLFCFGLENGNGIIGLE